ncbi:hypothetical protein MFLAVUS_000181 [Mucor flavus]|uniref:Zincin n=1 Tax=Mucor flavus TaxID=439312 RepID=A0ABP9YIZ9_9FUNG
MPPALSLLARQAATSNVCTTPLCHAIGNEFAQYVNLNVDPCSDFFEYTCGAWVASDQVEVENNPTDIYTQNERDSLQDIITFLNGTFEELSDIVKTDDASYHTQDKAETDKKNFQVVKNYYDSCLNDEARLTSGATPIFPIISEIENSFFPIDMPVSPQSMAKALAASTAYGIQTIFSFLRFYPDNDRDYKVVYIDVLDYQVAISVNDQISELYYRAYLTDILSETLGDSSPYESYNTLVKQESQLNNMTLWSASKIQSAITNMIEFEKNMMSIVVKINEESESENNTGDNSTSVEANTESSNTATSINPDLNALKTSSKTIDWEHFFSLMVSPEYATGNPTVVFAESHLTMIDELLSSTSVQVLQEYWIIQTIGQMYGHITVPNVLEVAPPGSGKTEPFFDATYVKEPSPITDQMICGSETSKSFYNIIGRFFALQTLGASKEKEEADQFVESIHKSWLADLSTTSWIDDSTKAKVIEKIEALKIKVAYSTTTVDWRDPSSVEAYYEGVSINGIYLENYYSTLAWKTFKVWKSLESKVNKEEWDEDSYAEQVNAFYQPYENVIEIPIGNFRGPFYNPEYPKYLNYGNLGATVGHELVHALDSQGRFFDAQGFYVDWFSQESSIEYDKRAQCFVNQYDKFSLGGPDNTRYSVNGTNGLGENIADIGGINIAFKSYHRYLEAAGITEQTLPGFENVTPDQLFFINSALFTCSTEKRSIVKSNLEKNVHSPSYFRNIGALQNSVDFAKAFNCPVGSPMNPEAKCSIW